MRVCVRACVCIKQCYFPKATIKCNPLFLAQGSAPRVIAFPIEFEEETPLDCYNFDKFVKGIRNIEVLQ